MSMRIRSMSAGRAGASVYNANVNGDQGGGKKLQGLAPTTNKRVNFILNAIKRRAYSTPEQRAKVFCINQLGGIGAPSKMFATGADGVNKRACLAGSVLGLLNAIYQLFLNRNIDNSGLKTYSAVLDGKLPTGGAIYYNQLLSVGLPPKEALINIVIIMISNSPEANAQSDPTEEAMMDFAKKYMPVTYARGF